ncbi:twin-arginine translocation signal domain-containing protein [Nonomuraea sp. NPDC050680]|uniref:twin-arginine translocation signal domain-containing protein n=1 Tax=Nonomuraea sp. NPDC050680 TaxID=3154630 RepID=UPI0033EAB31F
MDRRDLLKAGGVLAGSALLAGGLPGPWRPPTAGAACVGSSLLAVSGRSSNLDSPVPTPPQQCW